MVQRTVLKVNISGQKCQTKILQAVSGLEGVDKVEVDAAKGTVAVTGNADPYKIVVRIKKTKKLVEIVSIGPPPAPPKQDPPKKQDDTKKPDVKKPDVKKLEPPGQLTPHIYVHHSCPSCDKMSINYGGGDPYASCFIL